MQRRIRMLAAASLLFLCGAVLPADPLTNEVSEGPPAAAGVFSVVGIIEDVTGDPLPGARVTLTPVSGASRETVSDGEGRFVFPNVEPGEYLLRVEAMTRQPFETPVSVGGQAPKPLKIEMIPGLAEEVSVTGVRPGQEKMATGNNADAFDFDDKDILGLPLPARSQDMLDFVAKFLSPGAAGTGEVSILVDDAPSGALALPASAIDHIRINKDPYSPKFRRPGKARVEVETADGSRRRFHGGVGITVRNSAFESKNALAETKPDVDRRFFDASFSGPLGPRLGSFFLGMQREMTHREANINALTLGGPLNTNAPVEDRLASAIAHLYFYFGLHRVKLLYQFSRESSENRGVGGFYLPEQGIDSNEEEHSAQVSAKSVFSARYVNDFRLKVSAQTQRAGSTPPDPALEVRGAFVGGPNQTHRRSQSLKVDAREVGTYLRGAHTVRFGGAFSQRSIDEMEASDFGGLFEFATLEDFARGRPYVFRVNQGNPDFSYGVKQAEAFLQDEVKLRPDLQLMLGARYDWHSGIDDDNNVAPRVAVTYAPGSQKTVFRGGAGLFYEELSTRVTGRTLLYNGERVRKLVIVDPSYPNPFRGGSATLVPSSVFRTAPDLQTPHLFQTTFAVERQLLPAHQLTVEYEYLRGFHLFRARDVNAPPPGRGVRPDPTRGSILQAESTGKSRSHALTVTYRGVVKHRLTATAQYTLGHARNDVRGGAGSGFSYEVPADNYDLGPEWGRADFDRRHRFNAALVAYLPRAINLGTTLTAQSPEPFDITTGNDDNGDSYATDRPPGVTRNTGQGPSYFQIDARISKAWNTSRPLRRGESRHGQVQLVLDAFNLTNHTNYSSYIGVVRSPFFGRANAAKAARNLQFTLRYLF